MPKVELLKEFAKGWFGNLQQHSIHALRSRLCMIEQVGTEDCMIEMLGE